MYNLTPAVQRQISESLVADLWQTRQIAHPSFPGSKWVLVSPRLRSRLVMTSDVFDASARLSTSVVTRPGVVAPQWQLIAHLASADMVLAMAHSAEEASDSEPVAWSKGRLNRHLRPMGWRRTTGRLRSLLGARTTWESPDGAYRLTVASPGCNRADDAKLSGPDVQVSIGAATPVAVVVGLVDAVSSGHKVQGAS